ncbi:hypothetical protein LIER_07063 [Lithospermum erythrorhizon]|uniref:Uncharacterized protein n=1 Tax=Lithospermum erythrorhizon TaxID=34254 RepID=A0AAV3P6V8_LITER
MDSHLGLNIQAPLDPSMEGVDLTIQQSFKLVPWMSWDEWCFVKDALFSSSFSEVSAAIRRVAMWRSRGCIPVAVDVTASIIEIRQKDPFFRNVIDGNAEQSEEMLSMLYSMAIMRLVNGVVERTRKKNEISIAEAADAIDLPRMLIDVRHEGSHRELPSLPLVRLASSKALDWLKSYYWQPQKSSFFVGSDVTTNLRKEIKQKLLELASSLNVNRSTQSSSLLKRKHSKKDIAKAVKNVLRLYSSDSSEVATIVIEMLLKVSESLGLSKVGYNSESEGNDVQSGHDWKAIILKLSCKEPELLPTLLRVVLNKYVIQKNGEEYLSSQNIAQSCQIDQLACLFEWLLDILKHVQPKMSGGKPERSFNLPDATLFECLHKCVMASSLGDNQLFPSALVLAEMMGNSALADKLLKLSLLSVNAEADIEEFSSNSDSGSFFSAQEDSIHQATEDFELFKSSCPRNSNVKLRENPVEPKRRWKVVNSWKQCPIGMLPHAIGFSGRLPVLDINDDTEETETPNGSDQDERGQSRRKREPEHDVAIIDDSSLKRMRETTWNCESDNSTLEGLTGHLMIDGFWKKVSEDELNAISSAIKVWGLPLNLPTVSHLQAPLRCSSTKGASQPTSVG